MTIATTTVAATTTTTTTVATTKTPMRQAGRGRMVMMVAVSLFVLIILQFFSLGGFSEFLARATTANTSANTIAKKTTTKKTTKMKEYCHFELANGHFVGGNEEKWNWTWIPDDNDDDDDDDDNDEEKDVNNSDTVTSSSSSSSCAQRYQDYPKLLLQQQQQLQQRQRQQEEDSLSSLSTSSSLLPQQKQESKPQLLPRLKQPIQVISIGDSISRNQVQHFCQATEFLLLPQTYNEIPLRLKVQQTQNHNLTTITTTSSSIATTTTTTTTTTQRILPSNHAKWKFTNIISCSNVDSSISASILSIFGMIRTCWNGNVAANVYSRIFKTTIERIQRLLIPEIVEPLTQLRQRNQKQQQQQENQQQQASSFVPTNTNNNNDNVKTIFYIHSALWDISTGCNDAPTIHPTYEEEYRQGIIDLYHALQDLVPNSSIYWRTSTPITWNNNIEGVKNHRGRNRSNQIQLNHILKTTVTKYQLGTVIDWWNQIGIITNKSNAITATTGEEEEEGNEEYYDPSSNNNNNNGTTTTTTTRRTIKAKMKKKENISVVPESIWNRFVPDGIHPTIEPSLSGYNLFLNTLFDQEG